MRVSIVIPARNAAETVAETLESLRSQSSQEWEAIVVDDGSSDATAATAASLAAQDPRIRVVGGPARGVSAARNTGIEHARFDWLVFLDADDWLSPLFLEKMTQELARKPDLDVLHCGWSRVAPDGALCGGDQFFDAEGDLFDLFACTCVFTIHACIARKSLVEAVGGFDTSLRIGEDWDLWQRIARTGASFGMIRDVLAFYRMRRASASVDGMGFLSDGVRVIARGHAPDPRVPNPHPAHAGGRAESHVERAKLSLACWAGGLMIGNGEDATRLMEILGDARDPAFDPHELAESIFQSAPLPMCRRPDQWIELWPVVESRLDEFLTAFERQTLAPNLARRARRLLERRVLDDAAGPWPLAFGTTYAVRLEITAPIADIHPPASAETLQCFIDCEGEYLETIYLPVCDGLVPSAVIADAIVEEFAWQILGRFFERTIYSEVVVERSPEGASIRRGTLLLGEAIPNSKDEREFWTEAHDRVGWTVFLQEIWGRPEWPDARFYESPAVKEELPRRAAEDGWFVAEVSEELPSVEISGAELAAVLTVGGVALGVVAVQVRDNAVHADELRAALTDASGYELCRAAVREGLLGQPFADGASLRSRLAAAASRHAAAAATAAELERSENNFLTVPALATVSERALRLALASGAPSLVLGRRAPETIAASVSRRAMLPAGAAQDLLDAASFTGEPAIRIAREHNGPGRVIYVPDLLCGAARNTQNSPPSTSRFNAAETTQDIRNIRDFFEGFFAARVDPWQYTSPYEQKKYEQTLELLPRRHFRRALELGCAEGHFTRQLAPRAGSLLAADFSQVALERAAERCADLKNVGFRQLDIVNDDLPGGFDLIVCSEVLYYVGSVSTLEEVARKLADALEPGGYLIAAHANLVVDEPDKPGFDWGNCPFGAKVIGDTLIASPSLRLAKELRTPLYRIVLCQRERRGWFSFGKKNPEVIELAEQPAPLLPEVAAHVLWQGGAPRRESTVPEIVTHRLPILMYHRVAPTGAAATGSYRVTPENFAAQLRHLRAAGYHGIRLEDWQTAGLKRIPLPGKAVLMTFDDGYRDFLTYAWPLLKQYGFPATVFLVVDEIGKTNSWDRAFGEEVPLLGWPEIRQLRSEGVQFGSHSATHRPLTGLSVTEVVREGARSRAVLERELKAPIRAFAYPYGDVDPVVRHLIGACGYIFGLSCQEGRSGFHDSLLMLPRIEVTGSLDMEEFIDQLESDE